MASLNTPECPVMSSRPSMSCGNSSSSGLAIQGHSQRPSQTDPSAVEQAAQDSVIDLTNSDYETCDANRATKRQKLDLRIDVPNTQRAPKARFSQAVSSPFALQDTVPPIRTGRPFWDFGEEVSGFGFQGSLESEIPNDEPEQPDSLPPLPVRPWRYRPQGHSSREETPRVNQNAGAEVQTTPFCIEVPEAAPIFDSGKPLDFYPWKGDHPEDSLTDQTAKQGYYDRVQVSQNESNTARPSLYVQLKHRSGLKLLSSVFTAAIDKRQSHCRVTGFSTFKPPPRVTLTDIKRETWLRDLANPSVPLRRLSRTIPHGIRGRILLDQCVNKAIPIGRAVWLVKCVGANEIRAFKRKGTSAAITHSLEVKWVRDWSINVHQFIESVVTACGTPNWASTMSYVIRFAARLFQEQLLDQALCLDWFLQSLRTAPIGTLPIWLSMLGAYWTSLVRYRKRGRPLAESLLEKLKTILSLEDSGPKKQIADRLSWLIKTFAESHPACFVLPLTWRTYKSTLTTCFCLHLSEDNRKIGALSNRNERIVKAEICRQSGRQSPSQQVICLLDSADSLNDMEILSSGCLNLHFDHGSLIMKILEWVSTSFRRGSARVYVAVRLLRKWRRAGMDTDNCIVNFLQQKADTPGFSPANIYHLVCELVRSQSFAVGKYLQWLMARGAVRNDAPMHPTVQLLAHLPRRKLPSHVWNLRNTLLTKAGFLLSSENQQILNTKRYIHHRLPEVITKPIAGDNEGLFTPSDLSNLNWTIKSEIGHWIREHVSLHRKRYLRTAPNHHNACAIEISALTPAQFFEIRDIIECLGDLSLLADILKHTSSSDNIIVLISAVDTLNYCADSFKAIGALSDLFKSALAGYAHVNKADVSIIELISSLLEVGMKLPGEIPVVAMLRRDLSHFDKKFTGAVSSPVSDHTGESVNIASPAFSEGLHQLLNSGSGMDEPNMNKIFDMLSRKLKQSKEPNASSHEIARHLSQLRVLNSDVFDRLMVKWIISTLKSSPRPHLLTFLPPLIGVGCVTFEAFFALIDRLLKSGSHRQSIQDVSGLRYEMINLLRKEIFYELGSIDLVSYRFKTTREEYITHHAYDALGLVNEALANVNPESTSHPPLVPLLCELIIQNLNAFGPEGAGRIVEEFPNCVDIIHQALDVLLGLKAQVGVQKTQSVVGLIDDLSLSYCLVKLRLLLDANPDGDAARSSIVDLLFRTAESDIRNGERRWLEVLNVLPVSAAHLIRQRAEREILSLSLISSSLTTFSSEEDALIYLCIVEELSYSIPDEFSPSSMGADLGDKMFLLLQKTVELANAKKGTDLESGASSTALGVAELSIGVWFFVLLRLVALHRSLVPPNCDSRTEINHQTRLLVQICCISRSPLFARRSTQSFISSISTFTKCDSLLRMLPSSWANLQLQALDVCSTLVDTLSDEARYECARFLRDKCPAFLHPQNDARLLFLFGPIIESQSITTHGSSRASTSTPVTNLTQHVQSTPPPSQNTLTPGMVEEPNLFTNKLRFQQNGRITGPYPPKPWEMLGDAAPIIGINDTPVNLAYFGTRQSKRL
ncbi:hypothetical protein CIHG_02243 [Coccidioides immitis H538.4]|uniref:Mediator of RNA polymerase II transcription subunit 12 n=1 Tax=Coccidioides immitis H538.4 TaxID=396776 RepID=A0A0J8UBH3_COCIT|nr:hypothetical protein CIHG_02243 [Coccidioides immitis H538.4]